MDRPMRWLLTTALGLACAGCGGGVVSDGPDAKASHDAGAIAPVADGGSAGPDASVHAPDAAADARDAASGEPDGGAECTPESASELCAAHGRECGSLSATDRCGTARQIAECGPCAAPQTCGGGGVPNVCGVGQAPGDCATAPLRTTGAVYYYCDCAAGAAPGCVAGSDANSGASPTAPRRTLDDAAQRFGSMPSGSTIALCRGGVWRDSSFGYLPNKACGTEEATWCDVRDYVPSWASPAAPRPLVDLGSGGFGIAFVNDTRGCRLWNIHFKSSTANHDAGDGMVGVYDAAEGLDLCGLRVEGGKVGLNVQSSGTLPSAVRHSTITGIGQTGAYHAASNWTYDSNLFLNNQQAQAGGQCGGYCGGYYNHDHYISGEASNVVVRNSEYASTDGRSSGVVIYWTDFQVDPVFENNYVHTNGSGSNYAFSSSNNAANTSNYNGIIRRNRFVMPNANTAVEISACTGCQFLDNLVVIGADGAHGLGVPEQTGQSNPVNSGTVVRNNTFFLTGANQVGVAQNLEGDGYSFENNVVYGPGGTTCFDLVSPLAAGHPFTVTSYPSTAVNAAGNYCVDNGASPSVVFVDAANGDFRPVAGGPLVGTGNQTWFSPVAIGSVAWSPSDPGAPRTGPVDIGAFQHQP